MKKSGWTYLWTKKNGYKIIYGKNITIPRFFVKYYSLQKYNIESLKNDTAFFSHPADLNDPFDSSMQLIDISKLSNESIINFYNNNKKSIEAIKELTVHNIKAKVLDELNTNKVDFLNNTLNFYWNFIFKNYGIFSVSGKENSLLMWSYYTNHEGYAIKFEGLNFNETVIGPFPVNYSENYSKCFVKKENIEKQEFLYLTNIKSNEWKHEEEWRFILNKQNLYIPDYSENSMINSRLENYEYHNRTIILGYKFFKEGFDPYELSLNLYEFKLKESDFSNEKINLKIDLIEWIIDNKICSEQISTKENSSFELINKNIKIERLEIRKKYRVEYVK